MAADITIRPVQAGDAEAIEALFQEEADHHKYSLDKDDPYHPANAALAVLSASLDQTNINCGWLAFSNGEPAGIITTPQGLSGGVFVSEAFRGQKIAQALIRERELYFKQALGLTEIVRPICAGNEATIRLHTNLGYHFTEATIALLKETPQPSIHTILYVAKTL